MKIRLVVDPEWVTLKEAHAAKLREHPKNNPHFFTWRSISIYETPDGYEAEFDHLLRELPLAFCDAPVLKVTIVNITTDVIMTDGLYEPKDQPYWAQVDSWLQDNGLRQTTIRIVCRWNGLETFKLVNDYFASLRQGKETPTTLHVPTPTQ